MSIVVVTGATSFVGIELVHQLLLDGDTVYAVVRPDSPNAIALRIRDGLRIVELDLNQLDQLPGLVPKADVFYHLGWDGVGAAGRNDWIIQRNNIACSLQSIQAAAEIGCQRYLFAGSQAEYGNIEGLCREECVCAPYVPYGQAKLHLSLEGYDLAQRLGIHYVHARIFSVYGPGDHPWTLVSSCIQRFSRGEDMELSDGSQLWNFLYRSDAAGALREIVRHARPCDGHIFNVASTDTRVLRSFIMEIHQIMQGKGRPLFGAIETIGSSKPPSIQPDISKLRSITGWNPLVPFDQGIRKTLMSLGVS